MTINPTFHSHAAGRGQERFGLDESWLLDVLDSGRFVWLKGSGHSGAVKRVRSGHLIFIPEKNEFCVVVIDDRNRLAITVLTEKMARNSSWGIGLDEAAKLKAKRLALGEEIIDDSKFLRLYSEERGCLSLKLVATVFTKDWRRTNLTLCRLEVTADQIDPDSRTCKLTPVQEQELTRCVLQKISEKEIHPYCDFFVRTGRGKSVPISNKISGTFSLEDGELSRRWDRDST